MDGNFIITGAAQGFGAEFSLRVVRAGGKVVLADLDVEKGEDTCGRLKEVGGERCCSFERCDVTKREDWTRVWDSAEEFFSGPVDVLVNNAGVAPTVGFDKCLLVILTQPPRHPQHPCP